MTKQAAPEPGPHPRFNYAELEVRMLALTAQPRKATMRQAFGLFYGQTVTGRFSAPPARQPIPPLKRRQDRA